MDAFPCRDGVLACVAHDRWTYGPRAERPISTPGSGEKGIKSWRTRQRRRFHASGVSRVSNPCKRLLAEELLDVSWSLHAAGMEP